MPLKQFTVTYGRNYALCDTVVLNGVAKEQPLTIELARRAAHIAAGHTRGVGVTSTDPYGYLLKGDAAVKIEHI